MPGLFLTLEGGEGSGKSTQVVRLERRLRARGLDPLMTREPGGTPLAERVREVLLDPALTPGALSEALLVEAARADLVSRLIAPALAAGRVVVCDRYTDSTLAYQGGGRGLERAALEPLNALATGGLRPNLTLLFDLDERTGLERRSAAAGAVNRLDREPPEFHRRVRERFLELAREEPARVLVIDALLDPDRLEERVWLAVEPRLAAAGL
ncbi:MAG: dTMP kinase [Candidatus Eiseniibacteriota bacterium]